MLTFISLREMLTFISLRSINLATHQIPPEKKKSGPDTWPPIIFYRGNARAQTQTPTRAELGPVSFGLIPPRRTLGPRYSGPGSAREKPRAQVLWPKFPGYRSPVSLPELMRLGSNLPLSLSSSDFTMLQPTSSCVPLSARSHPDGQVLSFVERVLMGIFSVLRSLILSGYEVARRHGVECWCCSANAKWD